MQLVLGDVCLDRDEALQRAVDAEQRLHVEVDPVAVAVTVLIHHLAAERLSPVQCGAQGGGGLVVAFGATHQILEQLAAHFVQRPAALLGKGAVEPDDTLVAIHDDNEIRHRLDDLAQLEQFVALPCILGHVPHDEDRGRQPLRVG